MVKHIGIVLFDGVEELDAVGPWQVQPVWTGSFPDDGYTVKATFAFVYPPVALQSS